MDLVLGSSQSDAVLQITVARHGNYTHRATLVGTGTVTDTTACRWFGWIGGVNVMAIPALGTYVSLDLEIDSADAGELQYT